MGHIAKKAWIIATKGINSNRERIRASVMEVLVAARVDTDVANHVAEQVLGTKSMAPFLDILRTPPPACARCPQPQDGLYLRD